MLPHLKDLIIGPALPTQASGLRRLDKIRALAAFSPDALASIAYANQEIYLGLVVAGSAGLGYAWPISLAIAGLLGIVALSYFQTVHAYPSGGGSYVVARENLGTQPGLVAAAALLLDYVLNAAVSLTAGVAALASAFPALWSHHVEVALVLLLLVTIINLRGMQEAGTLVAIPVYGFLVAYVALIAAGMAKAAVQGAPVLPSAPIAAVQPITLFLLLHAFSTGSTALTGIEAISNGVPYFQKPEAKNAGRTLLVMAFLMAVLFLGTNGLTQFFAVSPRPDETILSAPRPAGSGRRRTLLLSPGIDVGNPHGCCQYELRRLPAPGGHSGNRCLPAQATEQHRRPSWIYQRYFAPEPVSWRPDSWCSEVQRTRSFPCLPSVRSWPSRYHRLEWSGIG